MKQFRMSRWIIAICILGMPVSWIAGQTSLKGLHKVASNDCGDSNAQPHLEMGSNWTYPPEAIPETAVGKNDPARTVAFGDTVTFSFLGLKPAATYALSMSFLSDSPDRVQSIYADDVVLEERLPLPAAQIVERNYTLNKSVYADGSIQISIKRLAGPNAIVSSLEVYSSDETPLKVAGMDTEKILSGIGLSLPSVDAVGKCLDTVLLNGTWKFNPAPPADFWKDLPAIADWPDIEVPGEWVMQGFEVTPKTAAGFVRMFDVPKSWMDKRVIVRFDAVFSLATVYVNGKVVGGHEGGFTPFELDITEAVKFGASNVLAVSVTSESLSDTLASASQYAVHALGGITRKVTLFSIPSVHIKSYHVTTEFDEAFKNATMLVSVKIHNQTSAPLKDAKLKFTLMTWPKRNIIQLQSSEFELPGLAAGQMLNQSSRIAVEHPAKWDNEHPNLYVLQCALMNGSETVQTVDRRFGFRQVEVRGNEIFINNMPVKLRGINRHEVHPLRGRSLTLEQWLTDVELFRQANCNLIRTSHYPPAEEFIDLCDELGLFVEEEAPLCWIGHAANEIWKVWDRQSTDYLEIIAKSAIEMIERDRSHPSIVFWSLANESAWGRNFERSHKLARDYDPSRPFTFHDQAAGTYNNNGSTTEIANFHYPGPGGPNRFADSRRPMWFGEYCHLNAYNRSELWTDPGLRDAWGRGFKAMWDNMYTTPAILGGAIWSGIDDTFYLPSGDTVGYGTWGPIDGWRRCKSEYWHVKKVYSPVRIPVDHIEIPADGKTITIPVENRHNFTNLSELQINWQIEDNKGHIIADIAPRSKGQMVIPADLSSLSGKSVYLKFISPLGFVADEYRLPIGQRALPVKTTNRLSSGTVKAQSNDRQITIKTGGLTVNIDKQTGLIHQASRDSNTLLIGGPLLMVLALNGSGDTQMTRQMKPVSFDTAVRSNRKVEQVSLTQETDTAAVTITDSYDIARGTCKLTIDSEGIMVIDYDYEMTANINPRQYGIVMTLPGSYNQLHWLRKGLWTVYPEDHIGRLEGTADAFAGVKLSGIAGPSIRPDYPWYHDTNALGTNDFRSTKEYLIHAYLSSSSTRGPVIESDGNQHVRCWIDGDVTRMLIAEYNNPGAEGFFRSHAAPEDIPLKTGDKIHGSVKFRLLDN